MANIALMTKAEQMYRSEFDTTDYASLLLDPAAAAMKDNIEKQKIKTDKFMASYPEGIDLATVDEALHPMITAWSIKQKEKYVKAVDVAEGITDTKDPRYIKAQEEMNQVIRAFERLDLEVNGDKSLGVKIQNATENKDNLAGGVDLHHEGDMHLFINGGILDSVIDQGIGDDGTLSYTSHEQTDNTEEITKLETELGEITDKTSSDYITKQAKIKELKAAKGFSKIKKVNQYAGHPKHNTGNVGLLLASQDAIIRAANSGIKWDNMEDKVGVAVDQIINQLGADGVRDVMFKYETYINGYIENKFGLKKFLKDGETPNPKFDAKKEELRKQDLTDEFREHFTGVLKGDHTDNFKQPETDLTTTQIENIVKRNSINALVTQDSISINDIKKIKLRSGFAIVQERGNYVIYQQTTTARTKAEEFSINDREALRTALYNYSGVSQTYRTYGEIPEFEEQIDTTPDYLFQLEKGKGGEQKSR